MEEIAAETIKKCYTTAEFSGSVGEVQDFINEDNIPLAQLFSKYDTFSDRKQYKPMYNGVLTERFCQRELYSED